MLKLPHKKSQKATADEKVWAIKNSLTDQQIDEAGERWLNHPKPYMTLAKALACAAKQTSEQPKRSNDK